MNENDTPFEEAALSEFLLQEVKVHYASDSQGILLANLGWAVMNRKPELKHLLHRIKLGRFIETRLAGQLEIKPSPKKPTEMRVIPLQGAPAAQAIGAPAGVIPRAAPRQYSRAALIAFTRPIPEGCSRVLNLEGVFYFEDQPCQKNESNSAVVLINEEDVLNVELPLNAENFKAFDEHVENWVRKTGVELEILLQPKKRPPAHKSHLLESVFDALVGSLSVSELKRVQLPLDVIVKLRAIQR